MTNTGWVECFYQIAFGLVAFWMLLMLAHDWLAWHGMAWQVAFFICGFKNYSIFSMIPMR